MCKCFKHCKYLFAKFDRKIGLIRVKDCANLGITIYVDGNTTIYVLINVCKTTIIYKEEDRNVTNVKST